MTGQREEIERLIGEAYFALRVRDWPTFSRKTAELSRYSWPEVEFIIHEKMRRVGLRAQMDLAFIYDEIAAAPIIPHPYSSSHSHSPLYPEITWEWVGGFYNGEAYFDATVREYEYYGYKTKALYTRIEVGQKDRSILEKINAFLERQLGTIGRVTYDPKRNIHLLYHSRREDCFRIAKKIMPYLHLPRRRGQAEKLINTTLEWARKMAKIDRERHRIALAERWERIVEMGRQNPSRWVLEMYGPNIIEWTKSLTQLARKPLTPREYELVSSFDSYLHRKGYLTARQVEVLRSIAKRHRIELPAIPA